ncbi:AIR synthase [candidate division WOR-3 bacterium]|nr:AIR synthase [candidate division WOR-3 bacterium]
MKVKLPEVGKISQQVFEELIFPRLGAPSRNVLVGPMHGVDTGIIRIGNRALALTTDPVFIVPEYGWERAAWFAIHILLSDAVTSGLRPRYLAIDFNLPMQITEEQLEVVWKTIHRECLRYGVSVVTGHTARYGNCGYPMVGGATVLAEGGLLDYVAPKFVRPGDSIIVTKGPAIEAAGIFAAMFPERLAGKFGPAFARRAEKLFWQMTVVEDAIAAISVGTRQRGVTAMHDATECGLWGGLYEMAQAGGFGVRVVKETIPVMPCVMEICELYGIDPYKSISEGTLIIMCRPGKAEAILAALRQKRIPAAVIGEVTRKGGTLVENGREQPLVHPVTDPFWAAYFKAIGA